MWSGDEGPLEVVYASSSLSSSTDKMDEDIEGHQSPAEDGQDSSEPRSQDTSEAFAVQRLAIPSEPAAASDMDTESLQHCAKWLSKKKLSYQDAYSFLQSVCDDHDRNLLESFRRVVDDIDYSSESESADTPTGMDESAGGMFIMV